MSTSVLSERDANVPSTSTSPTKEAPKSMEYHRQMLESRLKDDKTQQTYISPSDTIMSPASQKLAAFKNKHIAKSVKSKSLFAKAMTKNADTTTRSPPFADLPKKDATQSNNQKGSS
ncbi:hypothetical protein NA57DRAFT_79551 [Rhizodiscina lignyota]|uniref:Spo12-like protein n=1 Tax=Rhizodiscina lignyota TaxID=1504668 RepID=A0A9P4I8E7_9PEZI|nr:hypothetical protein NA57DRAFT_79551 [Rhizodiscina lignyota]